MLILREVLGFSAAEVAEQLDTSTASVNSALQRARKVIDSTAPTQQTVLHDLGDEAVGAIVTRWTDAWHAGDVEAIVAMLTDDGRYSMPPLPEWYRGQDEIRAFLLRGPLQSRWRFLPTTANGQLAFGTYLWDDATGQYLPGGLDVLTVRSGRPRPGPMHCGGAFGRHASGDRVRRPVPRPSGRTGADHPTGFVPGRRALRRSTVTAARMVDPTFAKAVSAFTAGPDPSSDETFNDRQQAVAPMCYAEMGRHRAGTCAPRLVLARRQPGLSRR